MQRSYKKIIFTLVFIVFIATPVHYSFGVSPADPFKNVLIRYFQTNPGRSASYFQHLTCLYNACEGNVWLMGKFIMTYMSA